MAVTPISESEALEFLKAIETGKILIIPEREPQDVYAGNVTYTASNGWFITIFNDANEWDYVDSIRSADGRELNFDSLWEIPSIGNYQPGKEASWTRYGIPGYMKYRCKGCSTYLKKRAQLGPPFLCETCRTNQT